MMSNKFQFQIAYFRFGLNSLYIKLVHSCESYNFRMLTQKLKQIEFLGSVQG